MGKSRKIDKDTEAKTRRPQRPRRKIVLFLVEGRSERKALKNGISELYEMIDENIEVFFPVIHTESEERGGDITTTFYKDKRGKTKWISPDNIEDAIYLMFLEDFFDRMKIMPKDVSEIIHIVDMDGAYIPDNCVVADKEFEEGRSPVYNQNTITCLDAEHIIRRNKQKRENLNYLSARSSIKIKSKTIPYSIYFFSSNLDHYLHYDANMDYRDKVNYAEAFSVEKIGNIEGFICTFSDDSDATLGMSYIDSWNFIKKGTESLSRHTNLNILFESIT